MFREPGVTPEQLVEMQNTIIKLNQELDEKNKRIQELESSDTFFGGRKKIKELERQIEELRSQAKEDFDVMLLDKNNAQAKFKDQMRALETRLKSENEQLAVKNSNLSNANIDLKKELQALRQKETKAPKEESEKSANCVILSGSDTDLRGLEDRINKYIGYGYKLLHFSTCYNESACQVSHRAVMLREGE